MFVVFRVGCRIGVLYGAQNNSPDEVQRLAVPRVFVISQDGIAGSIKVAETLTLQLRVKRFDGRCLGFQSAYAREDRADAFYGRLAVKEFTCEVPNGRMRARNL